MLTFLPLFIFLFFTLGFFFFFWEVFQYGGVLRYHSLNPVTPYDSVYVTEGFIFIFYFFCLVGLGGKRASTARIIRMITRLGWPSVAQVQCFASKSTCLKRKDIHSHTHL